MSKHLALQVSASDLAFLNDDWRSLANAYGGGEAVDRWLDALTRHYSDPARRYHNLHHVAEVLRLLKRFEADVADYDALRFAAWFHDAVYDTRKQSNEEESAALAGRALGELSIPPPKIDLVRRLILATKRHEAADDLPGLGIFLDADMSILGAEEETYLAYSEAIREEYAWVPEAAYREGRLKVLTSFLRRERLYYTASVAARLEARARRNLAGEIRALSAGP